MPKQTREQLLRTALTEYLLDFEVKTGVDIIQKYSITYYKLSGLTENKNCIKQKYILNIPSKVLLGYKDNIFEDRLLSYAEPIYNEQELPGIELFIDSFNEHFTKYQLTWGKDRAVSYMNMNCPKESKDAVNIGDLDLNITVVYHKLHTPFPRPLSELEIKEQKINKLEIDLQDRELEIEDIQLNFNVINKKFYKLKRKMEEKEKRDEKNYKQTQKLWREMYKTNNIYQDCPVCYEQILPDNLIVPSCAHIICDNCVRKCDDCPLCRQNYDDYIEYA